MLDRLVDLFLAFLHLFQIWIVVQPYEKAVVIFLGRWVRVLEPGIHWRAPLAMDKVLQDSVVLRPIELSPQSLTTHDGVSVVIEPEVICKTSDIKAFFLEMDGGDKVVADVVKEKIADYVRSHTWEELHSNERCGDEIATACRYYLTRRGVSIEHLVLGSFVRARSYRLWETSSGGITMD